MVIRSYDWLNSARRVLILPALHHWFRRESLNNFHCLTYDLDLQSQASQGQGLPSCQTSRSKVKRFKQESAHRQTDGHACTHTDATKHIISLAMQSIKMQTMPNNSTGTSFLITKISAKFDWGHGATNAGKVG